MSLQSRPLNASNTWEDERITRAKIAINELVFEQANGDTTLDQAERIACDMLAILMSLPEDPEANPIPF